VATLNPETMQALQILRIKIVEDAQQASDAAKNAVLAAQRAADKARKA